MPKRRSRGAGALEQLPSGRYRVRWRTLEGRYPSRTFTVKADAERFLRHALLAEERRAFEPEPEPDPGVMFDAVIDEWWQTKERSVKPRTAERYEDHLAPIRRELGQVALASLDRRRLQRFVATLERTYKPKTVQGCVAVLMMILKEAHLNDDLDRVPAKPVLRRVTKPKLTIPTRAQVDALALASDARLWAPVMLAGYCGLREGELLALHREDVYLEWRTVGDERIPPSVFVHQARNKTSGQLESTKTEQVRTVWLPTAIVDALRLHIDEYPGDALVPVSASVLQKSWERARKTCGIDKVRFHDLRHAAASMMIAAGLSVKQVSQQLGHANASQTLDTYSHLFPGSAADAVRRLDSYLAAS